MPLTSSSISVDALSHVACCTSLNALKERPNVSLIKLGGITISAAMVEARMKAAM